MANRSRCLFIALLAGVTGACNPGSELVAEGHLVYTRGLASDSTGLYWVDEPVTVTGQRGVWRMASGEEPVLLADGAGTGLALDDTHAYWFDRDAGAVLRVAKEGGPVESIARGLADQSAFVLTGKRILVVDTGSDRPDARILSGSVDGGEAVVIARSVDVAGWAAYPVVFRGRLYWQADDRIDSMPVAGGSVETLWPGGVSAGSVAADDRGLYFTTEEGSVMWLVDGREPVTLASDQFWASKATPAGGYVYFSTWGDDSSSEVFLRRAARDGGSVETLAVNGVLMYAISVAPGGPVYFSDGDQTIRAANP